MVILFPGWEMPETGFLALNKGKHKSSTAGRPAGCMGNHMKKAALHKGKMALVLAVILLACAIPAELYATTTQQQLDEELKNKNELQGEIDENNQAIGDLKDKEAALRADLKSLKEQLTEVSEKLEELEESIALKEQEIAETMEALERAKETEAWQYQCMVERIQYVYEQGETDYVEFLFSIGSFSDFLNYSEYMTAIAEYDRKMLAEYEETRLLIEEKEAQLLAEKAELDEYKLAAEVEKSKIAGLISQAANRVAENSEFLAQAEADAEALEAEMRKTEENIEALKKKIEEEKRLSEVAANAAWRDISEVTFADGDLALLAAIIYCEAGGEPYAGKLAVGAVVINRLLSSKYPDTVLGVITQKKQFSPVGSGRFEVVLTAGRANADCYRAAEEAMSGVTNVGNCLYFRTPIEGLTGINIGGHVFY